MSMNDYIGSRIPEELKKTKVCPHCGERRFYIQKSSFVYFSFDEYGSIVDIEQDFDDWNYTEQTKCMECGEVLD